MKRKFLRVVLFAALFASIIINMPFKDKNNTKIFTLPGLPRPIAKTPIAIISAGQSTDSYIIHDISNQLMLRSFFMPQARDTDLKEVNTIVFVIGYSSLGMKLQNISYEEEIERIDKLLEKAKNDDLKVLTIVMGGEQLDNRTEQMIRLIGPGTDYFIGLRKSSKESILIELTKDEDIPLTLVDKVNDIIEPFASAFR
ncbi:DUF6305 family protein [Lutispora saccharofermentans]|uniref:DUF6305 family protein n=1 Tax=Lutispora saccharofermentans TaxID=3024236 RepID=A0ABT1NIE0_9FIRM|nr:DUF6305 family protein [Lutispora saccharofermentans]MCQ1531040.1 DUF6305 family protein [Lutispora saccharofermentans]